MSAAADDAVELLGILADQVRLRVFSALVLGARLTVEVADRAALPEREVVRVLAGMEAVGLAARVGDGWHPCPERLREAVLSAEDAAEGRYQGREAAETAVLRTYLVDGRIVQMPAQRAKRLIVLDHIAGMFEPGVRYTEAQVADVLRALTDDYTALRRQLVDEGFLGREGGEFWRTGGTFDV
jgi:hypothetical protein